MENVVIVQIDRSEEMKRIETDLIALTESANKIGLICDKESAMQAQDHIGMSRKIARQLDEERKNIVRPYQQQIDNFKAVVDGYIKMVKEIDQKFTPQLIAYNNKLEAEEFERIRKLKEVEAARIAEEAKKAQDHVVQVAIDTNTPALLDHAELIQTEKTEILASMMQGEVVKVTHKGDMFTGSNIKKWRAKVIDWKVALKFVVDQGKWELLAGADKVFSLSGLNNYAKASGIPGTSNGLMVYEETTLSAK